MDGANFIGRKAKDNIILSKALWQYNRVITNAAQDLLSQKEVAPLQAYHVATHFLLEAFANPISSRFRKALLIRHERSEASSLVTSTGCASHLHFCFPTWPAYW